MHSQSNCILENFRPIKGTILYRASNPLEIKPVDLPYLNELGIRTIVDFRSKSEARPPRKALLDELYKPVPVNSEGHVGETGTRSPRGHYYIDVMWPILRAHYRSVSWVKAVVLWLLSLIETLYRRSWSFDFIGMDMLRTDGSLVALNMKLLELSGDTICFALRQLCQPSATPALLCCRLGKDRTGLVSALIQSLCGVDRHIICEDYALSEACLPGALSDLKPKLINAGIDSGFLTTPSTNMKEILQFVDTRYGSVSEYLQSIGFTLEEQEMLRRNVT